MELQPRRQNTQMQQFFFISASKAGFSSFSFRKSATNFYKALPLPTLYPATPNSAVTFFVDRLWGK
jgi:hypothetical protein